MLKHHLGYNTDTLIPRTFNVLFGYFSTYITVLCRSMSRYSTNEKWNAD